MTSAPAVGFGADDDQRAEAVKSVAAVLEPVAPAAIVDAVRTSPPFGAFAVAWVAAKFTEPARLVVTLFLVPRVAAARAALASALALTPR